MYATPQAKVQVMVRLSPEQAAGLDALCERHKLKRAVLLRQLLAGALAQTEEAVDAARA